MSRSDKPREWPVILVIVAVMGAFLLVVHSNASEKMDVQVEQHNSNPPDYRIYRVMGDGHMWAHGGANGGLSHHPECDCK